MLATKIVVQFCVAGKLKKEVFDVHPDPLSLLPNRIDGHPNGEAKLLMTKVIAKRTQADGFISRS
jgi:hypothetical protein